MLEYSDSSRLASPTTLIQSVSENVPGVEQPAAWLYGYVKDSDNMLTWMTVQSPDVTASLGIWGAIHSLIGIFCCCGTVYGALQPSRLWSRIVSKVNACSPRFKPKGLKKDPALLNGPGKAAQLSPYFPGKGWVYTEAYSGSTRYLVASDARHDASQSNEIQPLGSIQVDRRVDIDCPMEYQTYEEDMAFSHWDSRLPRPSPPHLRAPQVPANV